MVSRVGRRSAVADRDDLAVRKAWNERLSAVSDDELDEEVVYDIARLKLGRQKGGLQPRAVTARRSHACTATLLGMTLGGREDVLPPLQGGLAEVALAGRSNAGKSSLLNALCGARPRDGAAAVSSRPGYTCSIQCYALREGAAHEPALLNLVDLPGYGPAAAAASMRKRWDAAVSGYLGKRRGLSSVLVLIDCSLGVTADDAGFLDLFEAVCGGEKIELRYHVVITKADLLRPHELAAAHELVRREVERRAGFAGGDIPMVSSRSAAGVAELWGRLRGGALAYRANWESSRDTAPTRRG